MKLNNMTDKEKIECLSDLCRFLSKINDDTRTNIWKSVSYENDTKEKVIDQLIMHTPIIQGLRNQLALKAIGEQKTNIKNVTKAVEYLLGEKEE